MAIQRVAHSSESPSSTAFYHPMPHHPMPQSRLLFTPCKSLVSAIHLAWASTMVGQTRYSSPNDLKKQHHLLWLLGGIHFSHALPTQEDTYPCVLDIPSSLRNSPLLPLSSLRKLVSDTLFFSSSLVQGSTALNQFVKQSSGVPLVPLQMQHLSIYLVLQYAAVRGLNSVHAEMDKSRVWPPAFWEWPGRCAGGTSCDALQILRAELLPPFFPSCHAWNSPKCFVVLTWRSPERGNLCRLLYLDFSSFCSA